MFSFEVQCKKIQPIFISSCITLLPEDLFWFNFFADFTDAELVSTHKNGQKNLHANNKEFFNFPPTPQICKCRGNLQNQGKFLNLEIFHFLILKSQRHYLNISNN